MEAKELRIGNKLQKDNGEIFTVKRLDQTNDILVEEQNGLLTLDYNLFGIPLTEEWLLKLDFEKINHIHGYSFYSLSKSKKNKCHIDIYESSTKYMGYTIKHCKYLHQLQNIYFALTGEELTIKADQL